MLQEGVQERFLFQVKFPVTGQVLFQQHQVCARNAVEYCRDGADLFIAVTESDELNLLCCTIARQFNNKLSTIARVRNPEYVSDVSYLRSRLGIEIIINPEYEAAVEASRLLYLPAALSVNSFAHGQAELVKIQIPESNILDGKTIAYLGQNITNNIKSYSNLRSKISKQSIIKNNS